MLPLLAAAGCWLTAAVLHDAPARPPAVLSPATALVAAGGRRTTAATFLWSSTVLNAALHPPGDAPALHRGATAAFVLDPTTLAPAAYGARLVLGAGDLEGSLDLLRLGHARYPQDPWFPWMIGMELWQEGQRPREAAPWLRKAAELDPEDRLHHLSAEQLEGL